MLALKKDDAVCQHVAELQSRIDAAGQRGHVDQVLDVKFDHLLPRVTQSGHLDDEAAFRGEQGLLPLITQTTASQAQMEISAYLHGALKRLSRSYSDNNQKVTALEAKKFRALGFGIARSDQRELSRLKDERDQRILIARTICRNMEKERVAKAYLGHVAGVQASRTTGSGALRSLRDISEKQLRESGLLESFD